MRDAQGPASRLPHGATRSVAGALPSPEAAAIAPCHRRAIERVILAVTERLDEHHSLRDLASIAYLSPYYFHRIFRLGTGVPPGRFVTALRIDAAKRLLITSDLTVTEICFAVGYHSLGTFTTQFSRLVGLSPRVFRRLAAGTCEWRPDTSPDAEEAAVEGELHVEGGFEGFAFVGLFRSALAEGRPHGCTIAAVPGSYRLAARGEGTFHVLAGEVTDAREPLQSLLPNGDLLVARSGPVHVDAASAVAHVDLHLTPHRLTDPPILVAPAALIGQDESKEREDLHAHA
jgi:AraC family transcriptional regulator